jgi:hypothetical protein
MNVNGKIVPIEPTPGMWEGGIKDSDGQSESSMIYLTYCKNFGKCHNVPPANTTIKKNKNKKEIPPSKQL